MRYFLFLLIFILSFSEKLIGQENRSLFFDQPIFHFGTVSEENGAVNNDFYFTNETQDSIQIKAVKSSCGCTTPNWTKEKIGPGEEGLITVEFNPKDRPGGFNKAVTVITSGDEVYTLNIRGYVDAAGKSKEDDYPYDIGLLKFSTRAVNFGTVKTYFDNDSIASTLKKTEFIRILNPNDQDIEVLETIAPDYLKVSQDTFLLKSDSTIRLAIDILPQFQKTLGYQSGNISFKTSHPKDSIIELYTFASIEEYFPRLTPRERSLAPKLFIKKPAFDFKDIKEQDTVSTKMKLVNSGQSPLTIRKIMSNCSCLKATLDKSKLEPKEEAELSVIFEPGNRKGIQHKSVTVFSNDPLNPSQLITIRATVR
ncbi:MAG: DUF1573 domain-containing protein [Bacteroidota bacterium]